MLKGVFDFSFPFKVYFICDLPGVLEYLDLSNFFFLNRNNFLKKLMESYTNDLGYLTPMILDRYSKRLISRLAGLAPSGNM